MTHRYTTASRTRVYFVVVNRGVSYELDLEKMVWMLFATTLIQEVHRMQYYTAVLYKVAHVAEMQKLTSFSRGWRFMLTHFPAQFLLSEMMKLG